MNFVYGLMRVVDIKAARPNFYIKPTGCQDHLYAINYSPKERRLSCKD